MLALVLTFLFHSYLWHANIYTYNNTLWDWNGSLVLIEFLSQMPALVAQLDVHSTGDQV